jgi:hypothetical protein
MKEYRWRMTTDRDVPKVLITEGDYARTVTLEERETNGWHVSTNNYESMWTDWAPITVMEVDHE